MTYLFVTQDALGKALQASLQKAGVHSATAFVVQEAVEDWSRKQRTAPDLIGATAAAGILGVRPPHLARLKEQGRMPEPIPIEGTVDAYLREEVEVLGRELQREREARVLRRAERSTP